MINSIESFTQINQNNPIHKAIINISKLPFGCLQQTALTAVSVEWLDGKPAQYII